VTTKQTQTSEFYFSLCVRVLSNEMVVVGVRMEHTTYDVGQQPC
jgi:hypothetical protein